MISFLFWNLMGRQETNRRVRLEQIRIHLARMVASLDVDVLLFAESAFEPGDFTSTLNHSSAGTYHYPASSNRRIQLYSRLSMGSIVEQFNDPSDGRLMIRRVTTPSSNDILLAVVHFQSQLRWRPDEQALQATVMCRDIAGTEDVVKHQRTLLVGDLNMNPYDLGIVSAQGLNAVMTRDVARNEKRIVAGRPYRWQTVSILLQSHVGLFR